MQVLEIIATDLKSQSWAVATHASITRSRGARRIASETWRELADELRRKRVDPADVKFSRMGDLYYFIVAENMESVADKT